MVMALLSPMKHAQLLKPPIAKGGGESDLIRMHLSEVKTVKASGMIIL